MSKAVSLHNGLHEAEHLTNGVKLERDSRQAGAGGHTVQHHGHGMAAFRHLRTVGWVIINGYENADAGFNLAQACHADSESGFIFFGAKIEVEHF